MKGSVLRGLRYTKRIFDAQYAYTTFFWKISSPYSIAHSGLEQTYRFQAEVVTSVLMDFPVFWIIAPYTSTKDSEDFSASIFSDVQE